MSLNQRVLYFDSTILITHFQLESMRYIDTGSRDEQQALGTWLKGVLSQEVQELRWQSGFFNADGAEPFIPALERLRGTDGLVHAVIGANPKSTLRADVEWLADQVGLPRTNAQLGLVGFACGLYHPKCFHIVRSDGSQSAYVGSANLTVPGISGLNIEAGLILDSRDGDSAETLVEIMAAVDRWFEEQAEGLLIIENHDSISMAVERQLLVEQLPARSEAPAEESDHEEGQDTSNRPRGPYLRPLIRIPRVRERTLSQTTLPSEQPPANPRRLPVVLRDDYPANFYFAPGAASATQGAAALSGATLPGGATGIVVRLNKDSARHFRDGTGTANMSIPLAGVHTLRFGRFGRYDRPRAEFALRIRYIAHDRQLLMLELASNVMAYGYEDDESGHKDLRLVIPAGVSKLGESLVEAGYPLPNVDDTALLEWPTAEQPEFRLTYIEPQAELALQAERLLLAAEQAGELVGRAAAWLPSDISPGWP